MPTRTGNRPSSTTKTKRCVGTVDCEGENHGEEGVLELFTAKDIEAGEELFNDHAVEFGH